MTPEGFRRGGERIAYFRKGPKEWGLEVESHVDLLALVFCRPHQNSRTRVFLSYAEVEGLRQTLNAWVNGDL